MNAKILSATPEVIVIPSNSRTLRMARTSVVSGTGDVSSSSKSRKTRMRGTSSAIPASIPAPAKTAAPFPAGSASSADAVETRGCGTNDNDKRELRLCRMGKAAQQRGFCTAHNKRQQQYRHCERRAAEAVEEWIEDNDICSGKRKKNGCNYPKYSAWT